MIYNVFLILFFFFFLKKKLCEDTDSIMQQIEEFDGVTFNLAKVKQNNIYVRNLINILGN